MSMAIQDILIVVLTIQHCMIVDLVFQEAMTLGFTLTLCVSSHSA